MANTELLKVSVVRTKSLANFFIL
jgi:hypothetical protein